MRQLSIAFQTDKTPSRYIMLARQVDQYDFDGVSVYCDAPYQPSFGPLLLMAPHLRRARLGPAAITPARIHPIDLAAETALLAGVAAGGVYLGLARGAWLADHGIQEADKPIQAIREAIDIVRYLLSGGEGGYDGQVYRLAPHVRAPYPLPEVPIPILIGSWSKKLCALAGELANEVKVGGSANPNIVPVIQRYIDQGAVRIGRDGRQVGVVMGAVTVVDEDRERARQAAREASVLYLPVVAPLDPTLDIEPDLIVRLRQHGERGETALGARLIADDLLDKFAFAGRPEDVIAQVEGLFAAGAARVEFGTPHGLNAETGIDLLGRVVVPALKLGS